MYNRQYSQGKNTKGAVFAATIVIFFLTLSALNSIGWVPDYVDGMRADPLADSAPSVSENEESIALSSLPQLGVSSAYYSPPPTDPIAKPTRIVAYAIGLDLPILNPMETDVATLDAALLSGAVRYPLSAELNQNGNVFIFGHSSSLPVVRNQMFKAFNHISELRVGDTIKLVGDDKAHIYRVTSVHRADASEALIDLSSAHGRRLTLSTCDSFGGKSSRFVVEADFLASYADGE